MNWIKDIAIGIIIGGGMILPGVSGGVLAVIFGLYEKIIDAIVNIFKDFKKNFLFLLPLFIGLGLGVILFGKILNFVFDKYYIESCFTFIGLILGGVPVLLKEAKTVDNKKINKAAFIISLVATVLLFVLGKNTLNIDFSTHLNNNLISYILLFTTGVLFISGKVIPGISSSFLLMLIGMYQYLLDIVSDPFNLTGSQIAQICIIVLGMAIGGLLLVKLMKKLLESRRSGTYSCITGFVIGSIYAIFPGFSFNIHFLIGIILLILSFVISYKFSISEKTIETKK
ncbi:MAG: DUF368 domain-containing protein [Bacilli bacterium]|nr:DUF368 domain-containing protein [Bacilli bacterium]